MVVENPVFVLRVGYPRTTRDYLPEVWEKFGPQLKDHLGIYGPGNLKALFASTDNTPKIVWSLARALGYHDHYGGRTRGLHTACYPDLKGKVFEVERLVTRYTGEAYGASGGYNSYSGDYDYESGYLANMKAHRLAILRPGGGQIQGLSKQWVFKQAEHRDGLGDLTIETCNLAIDCKKGEAANE